ncbi:MAG TPA: hypothetical protein VN673_09940 [Clostridia bacterium]|nr:hypothetical protein [Clostridia bacterium]
MPTRLSRTGLVSFTLGALLLCGRAQAAEEVQITTLQPGAPGWSLGWDHAGAGTAYTVQFKDSLADGIWRFPQTTTPFPVSANQWTDPVTTNASRFYRVVGVPEAQRGKVLSATLHSTYTTAQLNFIFLIGGLPITAQYNVRLYKVTYETVSPMGARTLATGVLALPENVGSPLPLVSYQHGTILETNRAPSSMALDSETGLGLAMATSGYAIALPDYLGLGDSPGLHPFHHARSEATVAVDLLRAVKTLCATNGFPLNGKLFLGGYSQGGHSTLALCRELETYHTNEFTVTACAPAAGAYDMSGVTTADFLSGRAQPNPYYFLYLLASYQEVYHLAPTLADLLAPPYNTTLPPLMNGAAAASQINSLMPASPVQILKPELLAAFQTDPRHPLRLALQENDLHRWKPRCPMRLFHCSGDQDVIAANSQVAYTSFQTLGATQVQLIDPQPGASHSGCTQPTLLAVKAWFDSLR